jgi:hypothetical protein
MSVPSTKGMHQEREGALAKFSELHIYNVA